MKILHSSIFRALCAIVVGGLLIQYHDDLANGMVIAIGVIFFISGIVSFFVYFSQKKAANRDESAAQDAGTASDAEAKAQLEPVAEKRKPSFPLSGLGSVILGIILVAISGNFVSSLSYVLLAMVIIGCLNELVVLASAQRVKPVNPLFWGITLVLLVVAVALVVKPEFIEEKKFVYIGALMAAFGVDSVINAVRAYSSKREERKIKENNSAEQESATADAVTANQESEIS